MTANTAVLLILGLIVATSVTVMSQAASSASATSSPEDRDEDLRSRIRQIEGVLCHDQAPTSDQYARFEECNSFLKLVGKDVVDGCRDELFGHMPDHEERLSTVCAMTDEEKRSLGRSKIKCILQRTRSSPLMRLLAPRDEFFEGKRDRMEKVISCQESALGIQS